MSLGSVNARTRFNTVSSTYRSPLLGAVSLSIEGVFTEPEFGCWVLKSGGLSVYSVHFGRWRLSTCIVLSRPDVFADELLGYMNFQKITIVFEV